MYIMKAYSMFYISGQTQILKNFPSDKIKGAKNTLSFLSWAEAEDSSL